MSGTFLRCLRNNGGYIPSHSTSCFIGSACHYFFFILSFFLSRSWPVKELPYWLKQGRNLTWCCGCLGDITKFSPKFTAVSLKRCKFQGSSSLINSSAARTDVFCSCTVSFIFIRSSNCGSRSRVSIPTYKQGRRGRTGRRGVHFHSELHFTLELYWNAFNVLEFDYPPHRKLQRTYSLGLNISDQPH